MPKGDITGKVLWIAIGILIMAIVAGILWAVVTEQQNAVNQGIDIVYTSALTHAGGVGS